MTDNLKLPPLTQQAIEHVDGTPDADYPLRILRAYRENCDVKWEVSGLPEKETGVYAMMNTQQRQRAMILDEAIAHLTDCWLAVEAEAAAELGDRP